MPKNTTDERGSVTSWFMITCVGIFLAIGLVVDGGAKITANREAQSVAEAAARAGAGSVTGTSVRGGAVVVNPATASNAAQSYISAAGLTGSATTAGSTVTVTVTQIKKTVFLSLIGINNLQASATATAQILKQ